MRHPPTFALALSVALAPIHVAPAQSLESRVAAAAGTVSFEYATRPNVCGDGSGVSVSNDSSAGWTIRPGRTGVHIGTRRDDGTDRCDTGPARVTLRRDGGQVVELRVTVGGSVERAETHLGTVAPGEAARYLLALAPRLTGRPANAAVLGAEIADGVVVWPELLRIARDSGAAESARKAAVFWVSHEASAAATAGLDAIAVDDDATLSVRREVLFYLAQRPRGEGIPALLRVAESSTSAKLRKEAIWYLGQSRDVRALALFERLLGGR